SAVPRPPARRRPSRPRPFRRPPRAVPQLLLCCCRRRCHPCRGRVVRPVRRAVRFSPPWCSRARLLSCAGPCVVVGPRGGGRGGVGGADAPPVHVAVGATSGSPRRLPFWDASPAGAVHGRGRSSPGGEVMRAAGTSARRGAGGGGTPGEPLQWTGRCGMCPPGST